jgi:hypothetical protein
MMPILKEEDRNVSIEFTSLRTENNWQALRNMLMNLQEACWLPEKIPAS